MRNASNAQLIELRRVKGWRKTLQNITTLLYKTLQQDFTKHYNKTLQNITTLV